MAFNPYPNDPTFQEDLALRRPGSQASALVPRFANEGNTPPAPTPGLLPSMDIAPSAQEVQQNQSRDYGAGLLLGLSPEDKKNVYENQAKPVINPDSKMGNQDFKVPDPAPGLSPQERAGLAVETQRLNPGISPYQKEELSLEKRRLDQTDRAFTDESAHQKAQTDERDKAFTAASDQRATTNKMAQDRLDMQRYRMSLPNNTIQAKDLQAKVILSQVKRIPEQINAMRDKLGLAAGSINSIATGLKYPDPDIHAMFLTLNSFAALQPALHGLKSLTAVKDWEHDIGSVAQDPDATIRAIQALGQTAQDFLDAGTGRPDAPDFGQGSAPSAPQAGQQSPSTHSWSRSAWARANPGGDVNAAVDAAKQQGFTVLP